MAKLSSEELYHERFPKSRALYERAGGILPRGVTHDAWYMKPFPIYITKASGSRKWDADGYEYVDYIGGHGALLMGHGHSTLLEAVGRQIQTGTHFGACHELQLQWAELIHKLVPGAERVEFTNSGTEANMLAIRLARAFTGRQKIVRFRYHFAGFADHVMVGIAPPWNVPTSSGLLPSDVENTLVIPVNDEAILEQVLSRRDVALLMVEAAGAFSGVIGISPSFYNTMREVTAQYGTLLHFDEIVTGFRYSPGGVQAEKNIKPDLTSLGKILTGGVPGAGAIVGRADIMDMLSFKDDNWNRYKRVAHTGTFNGNPLCAAAGIATLNFISNGGPQRQATHIADLLRERMQQAITERCIEGCVYGDFSVFHVYLGRCEMREQCDRRICLNEDKERPVSLGRLLAINATLNGVHLPNRGYDGIVSAAHTETDVEKTTRAFSACLDTLMEEGVIGR
ncbi:MAG: aminotransferase class III-fold pyridoxal phosphate-dependent enzyme [Deltaproteobacteria bacterium]|nr:aminotransferase class III-fold pyridoxal phosphate-dependent enzyme [Deltaproteobacteria bacterium]MBW1961847.1 aminotransferase class III-fold pyridoxal phosphate-dependent enzyme [Deltaproteobacteria bacterium]MBW2153252.1 aminotransferase class III-fold pyridoxal phosphate-dependent enzyme [Deltaproteobacteria bacterium]